MNREGIIRMAREAGWNGPEDNLAYVSMLERFAALVAKHTLANIDPSSFISWQEGYEAGQLAERQKFLGALRQLHDTISLASDPSQLKARNK